MKFFNRNYLAALITLIFVIFCGGIYSFIYVPNNEKNLQEHRFRTLQDIDENIHKKIDNCLGLMSSLLTVYVEDDSHDEEVKKYIANYSTENFTLSLPIIKGSKKIISKKLTDDNYDITVNEGNHLITLQLTKLIIDSTDTTSYQMSMKMSFNQFIKLLIPQDVFDEFLIFSNGQLAFETFQSGISYSNDSLYEKKNGMQVSSVRSLNIGGKDYKLFLQPVNFTADRQWVIIGLLSNNRYQEEKNQLPTRVIFLVATIAFIIILAFCWNKLYQIGKKDRLTITHGIAIIAISMLLMSILLFTFLKYNMVIRPDKSLISVDVLTTQITNAFQNEVNIAYQKLNEFEDSIKSNPFFFNDIINLNNDSISFKDKEISVSPKNLLTITKGLSINQVFWLDRWGNERINWTSASSSAPHGNFKNREYFKKIVDRKEYHINKNPAQSFYLDQIVSWVSGSFTSVLSIPSNVPGEDVGAISFNFRSIHKPVLPVGFQFAIIDDQGNVLYHSDEARNLNENLLREFSENGELLSNLEARTDGSFKTKYYGKEYIVSLKRIYNFPYFMVVFNDRSYEETRDTEIFSFTFSMMLFFFFFAFLVFELITIFLASSNRSFFKRNLYNISWIGPKVLSHYQYNLATLFNALIIVWLLTFFSISTFLTYLYLLFFSVTFISIFLTALLARQHKYNNQVDDYKSKIKTLRTLLISLLLIDIVALRTLEPHNILLLLIYESLTGIAGWLFFKYGDKMLTVIRKRTGAKRLSMWNYKRSFSTMGLTRLIITSGIPIIFFYMTSYNYEQNLSIRYRQLQYAKELLNKLNDTLYENIKTNTSFSRGYYFDGAFINDIRLEKSETPKEYSREETITTNILSLFRININNTAVKEEKFDTPNAADTSFFYSSLLKGTSNSNDTITTYVQTDNPGKYLAISAAVFNYKVPSIFNRGWFGASLFWMELLFALGVFYIMIYNIINKAFPSSLHNLKIESLPNEILTSTSVEKKSTTAKKMFISYSKDDLQLVNKFIEHLSALQLDGKIVHWYCTELYAGSEWDHEIQANFDESDMICFMISSNFMKTKYIRDYEIKKAFDRRAIDKNFKIIPIILDFCKWTTLENNLGQFTALPYTAKPVKDFRNENMAWYIIEECLRLVIDKDLNPNNDNFYINQSLPKDVLKIFERIISGKVDI